MPFENKLKPGQAVFNSLQISFLKIFWWCFWCPMRIKPIARTETALFEAVLLFLVALLKTFE
jgi:hypothetical protein